MGFAVLDCFSFSNCLKMCDPGATSTHRQSEGVCVLELRECVRRVCTLPMQHWVKLWKLDLMVCKVTCPT